MLWVDAVIRLDEDRFDQVEELTQRLTRLSAEHGFALWLAGGEILRGAALAGLGRIEEGRALTRAGLDGWRALGTELILPHALSVAARVEVLGGRVEHALQLLEEALVIAVRTGERWYEPELHRRRGDLLRVRRAPTKEDAALAANCFERAVDLAARQGARLFEARARASGAA
jgi:adenylate cyclase